MKDCTQLVQLLKETVPDVPRDFASLIISGVAEATAMVSSAVRNYGSVYGQNQMLEYSTDGKISDVTGSFQGRAAISDSVLARLANDLETLKANYDKAWEILPQVEVDLTTTVEEELSASFSVGTAASAPASLYSVNVGFASGDAFKVNISQRSSDDPVASIEFASSASSGYLMVRNTAGEPMRLRDIVLGLPGTIVLDSGDHKLACLGAISIVDPYTESPLPHSMLFIAANARITILVQATGYTFVFPNVDLYSTLDLTLESNSIQSGDLTHASDISMPPALKESLIANIDEANQLTYSVAIGDSELEVSKVVSKQVPYTVTYPNITNESGKIQALINAIP